MSCFSWVLYSLPFLELYPQFDCTIDNVTVYGCSARDQICQGTREPQVPYWVNYTSHTSIHNWVEQVDLVCATSEKIALIGSLYFIGWCTTLLVVPWFADKRGRRIIFFLCVLGSCLCMATMLFTKRLIWLYTLMFLCGFFTSGRYTTGFVFGSEFCPQEWLVVFGMAQTISDGSVQIWVAVYFDLVSHYAGVVYIGLAYGVFCLIVVAALATESPLWQLKIGRTW